MHAANMSQDDFANHLNAFSSAEGPFPMPVDVDLLHEVENPRHDQITFDVGVGCWRSYFYTSVQNVGATERNGSSSLQTASLVDRALQPSKAVHDIGGHGGRETGNTEGRYTGNCRR